MADDPNTKKIQITGNAAAALEPAHYETMEGGKRSGNKSMKRKLGRVIATKDGGGSTSPGTMVQLASTHVPGPHVSTAGAPSNLSMKAVPIGGGVDKGGVDKGGADKGGVDKGVAPAAIGGAVAEAKPTAPEQKVVLKPKSSKVVLGAKTLKKVTHTKHRKTIKKVHVSLHGLSSKLHRAKTIRNKASKNTLEEVKAGLVKAGLIKADTKAPEDVLRQMYADFMLLKKRAI